MASASKRQSKAAAAPPLRGGKRQIALTLDPDLIEELDAIATEEERSRARTIERALRRFVQEHRRRESGGR